MAAPPKNRFSDDVFQNFRAAAAARAGQGSLDIPLDQIEPDTTQPRRDMHEAALIEMAETVRRRGILQPITVLKIGDGKWRIVYGERRWRAAQLAGLKTIPAFQVAEMSDPDRLIAQVVENQHRAGLSNSELARAIDALSEVGERNREIAIITGVPQHQIQQYRAIRRMPPALLAWVDRLDIRTVYELLLAWERSDEPGRGVLADRLGAIDGDTGLSLTDARRIIRTVQENLTGPIPEGEGEGGVPSVQEPVSHPANDSDPQLAYQGERRYIKSRSGQVPRAELITTLRSRVAVLIGMLERALAAFTAGSGKACVDALRTELQALKQAHEGDDGDAEPNGEGRGGGADG